MRAAAVGMLCCVLVGIAALAHAQSYSSTLHVPGFDLPPSSLASEAAAKAAGTPLSSGLHVPYVGKRKDLLSVRQWGDEHILAPLERRQRARYPVRIEARTIGGVPTEIFTPESGVPARNRDKVLINLHGGGFMSGAIVAGRIESIPIADVGRLEVVSVNYRLAPEYRYPAATEDVVAVYNELLKAYRPADIGIYGCSAGGTLTAQTVAWLIVHKLPLPGAVGMFCGTGELWGRGDSAFWEAAENGTVPRGEMRQGSVEYLRDAPADSPLVFPMRHPQILSHFPPALLITSTRGLDMSGVVNANNELTRAGVESHLFVWDGLRHAFFYNPDLPESREAYGFIAEFFSGHLGLGHKNAGLTGRLGKQGRQ